MLLHPSCVFAQPSCLSFPNFPRYTFRAEINGFLVSIFIENEYKRFTFKGKTRFRKEWIYDYNGKQVSVGRMVHSYEERIVDTECKNRRKKKRMILVS